MEKIIRDGKVAVAVTKEFGAGWSTWNSVSPMDARFNQLFLDGKHDEAERICEEEGFGYGGGVDTVEIEWVPVGSRFIIQEYDGKESIDFFEDFNWFEA